MGIDATKKIATDRAAAAVQNALALNFLATALEGTSPGLTTQREFETQLALRLQKELAMPEAQPTLIYAAEEDPFFATTRMAEAYRLLEEIEKAPLRVMVEALQAQIASRMRRRDPWLEGRLHLGIALAALEDWEAARDALEELIALCEGGDRAMQKNMAMAV